MAALFSFGRPFSRFDGVGPLALRWFLAPVFIEAGWNKLTGFSSVVEWFGTSVADGGLGLPFPLLMASLSTGTELLGGIALFIGLGVRLVTLPLMVTMAVAAWTVHWQNGWLAIAQGEGFFATPRTEAAVAALSSAKDTLRDVGAYDALVEHGSLAILNNGIEFAATYFVMLVALLCSGGGRSTSIDDLIRRVIARRTAAP